MESDNLRRKNRALLLDKVKAAKQVVQEIVSEYGLRSTDTIGNLLLHLSQKIEALVLLRNDAIKRNDLVNKFISEINHNHYSHMQQIIGLIIDEDLRTLDSPINWLMISINWRVEKFDDYWSQLEKGEIRNPYLDR